MAEKTQQQGLGASEEVRAELPPGVKEFRTLEGHKGIVMSVAFDPQDGTLASGSATTR